MRLLEASDGVGGRVRTDEVDGFLLDRGFQVREAYTAGWGAGARAVRAHRLRCDGILRHRAEQYDEVFLRNVLRRNDSLEELWAAAAGCVLPVTPLLFIL